MTGLPPNQDRTDDLSITCARLWEMKRASKLKIAGKDRIEDICTEETLAACHCGETRLALTLRGLMEPVGKLIVVYGLGPLLAALSMQGTQVLSLDGWGGFRSAETLVWSWR